MKIDGKFIAAEIKSKLRVQVENFKSKAILPHLSVILIGDDPASVTYVGQKQKVADEIGVKLSVIRKQKTKNKEQIINIVKKLNYDPLVHGIIIQRPLPLDIDKEELNKLVVPEKDIDGFHPNSPFTPPVASAVLKIIEWVSKDCCSNMESPLKQNYCQPFKSWLKEKKILVIGRGETAGKPIADTLKKMSIPFTIAHSKTENLKELCLASDIIISCVGKSNIVRLSSDSPHNGSPIVRPLMISNKTILLGVGLHSENGKLQTDYDQEEIKEKAAYYTPVPGGVGPVNVACLFENLLLSVKSFMDLP